MFEQAFKNIDNVLWKEAGCASELAYVIAIMNMILHGIEAPNIIHTNTLTENLADIQGKDQVDVIAANPPFGGKERKEVQQNFPIRTGETAFLFLQHFIKILKTGGRAVIPVPSSSRQAQIVRQIEEISEETQRLESLCQRKLAALDELKKSLLHQAFSGLL